MTCQECRPDRRTVLGAAVLGGVALPLVAACGGSRSEATSGPLGPVSQVPVGGGHVFADHEVVVTQPKAGEFKAFSAVCTHQGCLVSSVADGQIRCPCHGSAFSITDGSVVGGPAPAPLPAERIKVAGGSITLL